MENVGGLRFFYGFVVDYLSIKIDQLSILTNPPTKLTITAMKIRSKIYCTTNEKIKSALYKKQTNYYYYKLIIKWKIINDDIFLSFSWNIHLLKKKKLSINIDKIIFFVTCWFLFKQKEKRKPSCWLLLISWLLSAWLSMFLFSSTSYVHEN